MSKYEAVTRNGTLAACAGGTLASQIDFIASNIPLMMFFVALSGLVLTGISTVANVYYKSKADNRAILAQDLSNKVVEARLKTIEEQHRKVNLEKKND